MQCYASEVTLFSFFLFLFFFNDTATTEIYTLSLHDALPICSSTDYYYDDKSSPMWCTNDNERCFSSSDDDELDLLKYTRRRRRRRSRPNLRKFLPILLGLSETLFLETVINIQPGILPDTW